VIILPTVHLNRENSSSIRECFITHFIDPRLEVEAFNRRYGSFLLILSEGVVVLTRRVDT
jgi:hypothetical protein